MCETRNRGSVLIVSLWAISVFSVFVTSLTFSAAQHTLFMKREIETLQAKADFISGISVVSAKIFNDPKPHEDSRKDAWYGMNVMKNGEMFVMDEESKLNLNFADEAFVKNFLVLFEENKDSLKGEIRDVIKAVLKTREKAGIKSLEELYLLEDLELEDIEKLKPYFTVYAEFPLMNINTLNPLVLEAYIESLSGDDFAKKSLLRAIQEFLKENIFIQEDLMPNQFLEKLGLRASLQMLQLANQLLPGVTVDSKMYSLKIKSNTGKMAEAVVKENPELRRLEVISWYEN